MSSFTTRYGNPATDCLGAHIRAHRRHNATVVAVAGRVEADNVEQVTAASTRFVGPDTSFILDLSAVSEFGPAAVRLVSAVDEGCAAGGVQWALVASDAVTRRLVMDPGAAGYAVVGSLAEAEHHLDDDISHRRRVAMALLRHSA